MTTKLNGAKPLVREYVDANGLRLKVAIDEAGIWFCPTGCRTWKLATLQQLFDVAEEWHHAVDGKTVRAKPGDLRTSSDPPSAGDFQPSLEFKTGT